VARVSIIIVGSQASIAASLMTLSRQGTFHVAGCINDVAGLFSKLSDTEPSVILIDFALITEAQYAMLTEVRRSHPNAKVIFLCDGADQAKLIDAFRHGASGYIETKDREAFLAKAIEAVSDGEIWVPRQFVSQIVERLARS
jgi:DNA-binding NarL/FixJ family response regulator